METTTRIVKVRIGMGYEEISISWAEGSGEILLRQRNDQIMFPMEEWGTFRQIIENFIAREGARDA